MKILKIFKQIEPFRLYLFQLYLFRLYQYRRRLVFLLVSIFTSSCAYQVGRGERSLPWGYQKLAIPIFKNKSMEPGVEVEMTNSLRKEFYHSQVAKLVEKNGAEAMIEGVIDSIKIEPTSVATSDDKDKPYLPSGAALATVYRISMTTTLRVVRMSDSAELWKGSFAGSRTYNAPQVTLYGVNSVNPLYNLSARRQNLESIASELMSEAHGRITENF